jgi:hypothetical protein
MSKALEFPKYHALISFDLRCFDLRQRDYGVAQYLETLGFLPHMLLFHETNLDQIHLHRSPLSDAHLNYMWCAQRGMPGAQTWTQRQLRELVDIIHTYGVKVYQGFEATWQYWPDRDTKAEWAYAHPEMFIVYRNGKRSDQPGDTAAINPLVRMKGGRPYVNLLCQDLIRYLDDYQMDGFFSADGMAGLSVMLEYGDYSPDMIAQFAEFSGIHVEGDETAKQADWIWTHQRSAWIQFYVDRWARFYRTLSQSLKQAGKGLATMDPWARGPADSVYDYGFDYRVAYEAGLDYLCLQSREENWGRRSRSDLFVWEPGQAVAAATIKAQAPDLTLLWAVCTCNAPENWHMLRDIPIVLERQLMTLPLTTCVDATGRYKRAFDGFLAIFGIDLDRHEWDWMRERLDFSFLPPIEKTLGPSIVWSDSVYTEHLKRGRRWELTTPLARLILSGIPIRSAVNSEHLPMARSEAYVIVDPLGITEREVDLLLDCRARGADLLMVGEVDHPRLLECLGLKMADPVDAMAWTSNKDDPQQPGADSKGQTLIPFQVYLQPSGADILLRTSGSSAGKGSVIASVRRYESGGNALYVTRTRNWPTADPSTVAIRFMTSTEKIRSMQDHAMKLLPSELELRIAELINASAKFAVVISEGQLAAYKGSDGTVCCMLENIGNLYYTRPFLKSRFPIAAATHYAIKNPSPAGYIIARSVHSSGCQVNVVPDGVVPIKLATAIKKDTA